MCHSDCGVGLAVTVEVSVSYARAVGVEREVVTQPNKWKGNNVGNVCVWRMPTHRSYNHGFISAGCSNKAVQLLTKSFDTNRSYETSVIWRPSI
jgi:hypothetical protein